MNGRMDGNGYVTWCEGET